MFSYLIQNGNLEFELLLYILNSFPFASGIHVNFGGIIFMEFKSEPVFWASAKHSSAVENLKPLSIISFPKNQIIRNSINAFPLVIT